MSSNLRADFHRAVYTNINTYIKTITELAGQKDLVKAHAMAPDVLTNGRSIPHIILDDLMSVFVCVMQNVEDSAIPFSYYKQLMVARHGEEIDDKAALEHLNEALEQKRKLSGDKMFLPAPEFSLLLDESVPEDVSRNLMTIWKNSVTLFGQLLYSEDSFNASMAATALLNHMNTINADLKEKNEKRKAALDTITGKNKGNGPKGDTDDDDDDWPEIEGDGLVVHYAEDIADIDTAMADLIGLQDAKDQIKEIRARVKYKKALLDAGLLRGDKPGMDHYVFRGPPGTGKTTFGRLIGKIYKDAGLVDFGHVVECSRVTLVGEFIGKTAVKTQSVIDSALGGVLFVDEAYSLFGKSPDFGPEAVEVILRAMEVHKDELIVVFAGYPDKMDELITSNPGLTRRFKNTVNFKDFQMDELMEIFDRNLKSRDMSITPHARNHVANTIQRIKNIKGADFGNAGTIENIVEILRDKLALAVDADGTLDKVTDMITMEQEVPKALKKRLTRITVKEAQQIIPQNEVSHTKPRMGFLPN